MFKPHFFLAGALLVGAPLYAQTPAPLPTANRAIANPGVRREAGSWLLNESIFAVPGENRGLIGGPVFVSNLRRDKKQKLPFLAQMRTLAPLKFATLPLPTLRQINAPNFDFGSLDATLKSQVAAARASGAVYIGWSISAGAGASNGPLARENAAALLKRLRLGLDAAAPDSALIFEVDASTNPALAASDIDAAAPSCDAVLLRADIAQREALWPLKMARRVAEEQRDFDLPIFVAPGATALDKTAFDAHLLEFWMGGATGFVLETAQIPAWSGAITRNPGLWSGAVTLEDTAVLPSFNPNSLAMVNVLREAGRVPLAGRLPDDKRDSAPKGESLFAVLDEQTSLDTLSGLDKAARNGATIYLEGLPDLKQAALLTRLSDMTGTTIQVLSAPKPEILTLGDAWLFGEARGREIGVNQRVKWTIKRSLVAQARKKKGEDVLAALSVAQLAGDENGLLLSPLGKGRVIWLAHAPSTMRTTPENLTEKAARRAYYAAIAGSLQGGLAKISFDPAATQARADQIHFALRASKTGIPIIALFNNAATDASVTLSARSDAPVALDLSSEREIATKVSGYSSNVQITVPARGFAWLTFGATRAALDKERLTPRSKAKTR